MRLWPALGVGVGAGVGVETVGAIVVVGANLVCPPSQPAATQRINPARTKLLKRSIGGMFSLIKKMDSENRGNGVWQPRNM
jgi:hypothetical protein